MNETTATVVVTYNRKEFLLDCLDALRNQTYKLDAIYIIDNLSTDGTPELLLENNYIPSLPPTKIKENLTLEHSIASSCFPKETIHIIYIRKCLNDGGAGGFYEGLKQAYDDGHEWIWVMDDDVEAVTGAVEILNKWKKRSLVIQPSRIHTDNSELIWAGWFLPEFGYEYHSQNFQTRLNNLGYVYVNFACFEGMFINRKVIEKIGYPDKRFFFCGDDTMYGFKASQLTDIILIKDQLLIRKIIKKKSSNNIFSIPMNINSPITSYYLIRNEYLKMSILTKEGFVINKKVYGKKIRRTMLKEIGKALITLNIKWAKGTCRGYLDGKNGKFEMPEEF